MTIGEFCVRETDLANADETVRVAASRLRDRSVGSLLICNQQKQPIGILTDRDVALRIVADCLDPNETIVSDIMSVAPTSVHEDASLEDALHAMRVGPFRRLPVVNEHNELVGVVSLDDILDVLSRDFNEIGGLLRREGPESLAYL